MKKVLFLDRDGTLVIEPPLDYQLDSFEKLEFYPEVFQWLVKISREFDYELVMVTNQDGLGTDSFPEDTFWPVQNFIIEAFKNEGVEFQEILIDRSFPEENKETRKPGLGLLQKYIYGNYDLENSFVVGDRNTDIELANRLNAKGIFIGEENKDAVLSTGKWEEIYNFLKSNPRKASIERKTNETKIAISVNLDGKGKSKIQTGIGFLDHMLDQIAKHAYIDLEVEVQGDLHIDEHHTVEDIAIVLGEAFKKALGSKKNIERYGFLLPMDDCLAQVALDFGGRPEFLWDVNFKRENIGEMPTEMFSHFFKSFSNAALCNRNIKAEGENEHHKIESIFKAFAKALKMAIKKSEQVGIPSTKGVL